jgi:hypothetical protein
MDQVRYHLTVTWTKFISSAVELISSTVADGKKKLNSTVADFYHLTVELPYILLRQVVKIRGLPPSTDARFLWTVGRKAEPGFGSP